MLLIVKPVIENYLKAVLDGYSGVIGKDDNIIASIEAAKYYSKVPRVEMRVYRQNNNLEWE